VKRAGRALRLLAALVASAPALCAADQIVTPPEHRRATEQTFLTFPEWFLVYSPAEYAAFVKAHPPSEFPFLGHVGQFWTSYGAVCRATRDAYPFNLEYHVMIWVIGVSTAVEYGLRSGYETVVGRITALTADGGSTAEDRFAARVAQDYVDFIRVRPWYEYDFWRELRGLWRDTPAVAPGMLRKWERRYALTTEYLVKALYARAIGSGSQAAYGAAAPVTAAWLDRLPAGIEAELQELHVLRRFPDGSVLVTLPRYAAFTDHAAILAGRGVSFREIAGNRDAILVTAIAPSRLPAPPGARVLFTQPILTRPGHERVALVTEVASLSKLIDELGRSGRELEHVYDY
jgi:hypothetical protein